MQLHSLDYKPQFLNSVVKSPNLNFNQKATDFIFNPLGVLIHYYGFPQPTYPVVAEKKGVFGISAGTSLWRAYVVHRVTTRLQRQMISVNRIHL